jgi:hypothetical protein
MRLGAQANPCGGYLSQPSRRPPPVFRLPTSVAHITSFPSDGALSQSRINCISPRMSTIVSNPSHFVFRPSGQVAQMSFDTTLTGCMSTLPSVANVGFVASNFQPRLSLVGRLRSEGKFVSLMTASLSKPVVCIDMCVHQQLAHTGHPTFRKAGLQRGARGLRAFAQSRLSVGLCVIAEDFVER